MDGINAKKEMGRKCAQLVCEYHSHLNYNGCRPETFCALVN